MNFSRIIKGVFGGLAVYAFFACLLWWMGHFNFSYQAQMSAIYSDALGMSDSSNGTVGLCYGAARYMAQFFADPAVGIAVLAALLAAISLLLCRFLRSLSGWGMLWPLSLLPGIALAVLHYNISYTNGGTVSALFLMLSLNVILRGSGALTLPAGWLRILAAYCICAALYVCAAPAALLFSVVMILVAAVKWPKCALWYLGLPIIPLLWGYISYASGAVCDYAHSVLPVAYFLHRLPAPDIAYLPWGIILAVVIAACVLCFVHNVPRRVQIIVQCVLAAAAGGFAVAMTRVADANNEAFKQLNCYITDGDYAKVVDYVSRHTLGNLLLQNCYYLALAEQGMLADSLFTQPAYDIRSIYITGESNPSLYMLLSDVYYSMGHIALAQRHAFEANESMGNLSPRMLRRLATTNIIYGNYSAAEKYIKLLAMAPQHREWAAAMRLKLSDEAVEADPELSAKRACLFPANTFSALKGLDHDLKEIIRGNPSHGATREYLGSLYLLSKDLAGFKAAVDEFYLPDSAFSRLPKAFREGIIAYYGSEAPDSIYQLYGITEADLQEFENFKANPSLNRHTAWYFLNFVN